MKIVAGKYYRTRDGRKVGPMYQKGIDDGQAWRVSDSGYWYLNNGKLFETEITDEDLIAEWTDTPVLWRDMTPAEKGALLVAEHEGNAIESSHNNGFKWKEKPNNLWHANHAYRVKPEPTVEAVTLQLCPFSDGFDAYGRDKNIGYIASHRITFNMINGQPDCASIRMEEL